MPANLINTQGRDHFQRTLTRYLELNKRNARELVIKKATSAVVEFYKAAKDAAPDPAKIKADVLALGWRVKRKAGAWPLKKGERRGSKGPLNRMRAAVIRRRQRAIGYAASGFLPAMQALGVAGKAKDAGNFPQPKGSLQIVGLDGPTPGLAIINSTPGIVAVDKKHGIIEQGLKAVADDMLEYIKRKQAETMNELKR